MKRHDLVWIAIAGFGIALAPASSSEAQGIPSSAGSPTGTMSPSGLANPYTNPYLNPYMNPYMMMQGNPGRNNTLLYLWGAQQAPGGLLSSPALPGRRTRAQARPAEMPRSVMTPGGGAARYYQRGSGKVADESRAYYGRSNRYFGNNGR